VKKFSAFAFLICLLVLGVAAVLSTQNPGMQASFRLFFSTLWANILDFTTRCVEGFRIAFSK
jgi:hypothetical protein